MNIIIFGKGGREHALAYQFARDERVQKVYVYPGNPGMSKTTKVTPLTNLSESDLFSLLKSENITFGLVGPEDLISNGFADKVRAAGIKLVAPSVVAAQLETSKVFSKRIMQKYNVKTAKSFEVYSLEEALSKIPEFEKEVVIKLSGLHAGKGVFVADSIEDAKIKIQEWKDLLSEGVLLEERLHGYEVSLFYLCKKDQFKYLGEASDYKRAYDENKGPNTGGMGCYSPNPTITDSDRAFVEKEVVQKTLNGMLKENIPFEGILFVGMMMTAKGPYVLEYNVRFGDPETQTFLPRIQSGFLDLFLSFNEDKNFKDIELKFKNKSIHVVKASHGYPDSPRIGDEIQIHENLNPLYFFAGVKEQNGKLLTNGGRVCGLTSISDNYVDAFKNCYQNLSQVSFKDEHFRTDIGKEVL